jgi:hypothetical protein
MSSLIGSTLVGLLVLSHGSSDSISSSERAAFASLGTSGAANARAGIAIVGTGGASALDRVTVLDSATGQFIAVTRPACSETCAPLDSASGTIANADVARLFALIESEHVFSLSDEYAVCLPCTNEVSYATTVQANGRRKVITSDGELTPVLLGRVHVALAEAIRAARGADDR